ncbi:MAG: NUDIX domain-containing protein [Patescibacteria group bacterium]
MHTTDPQNERFDIVDENDTVIGQAVRRNVHLNKSLIHRSITVLVFVDGKLLLQKRSQTKDTYPLFWTSSCSGHVALGDSYEETAKRELTEELGIKPTHPLTFLGKDLIRYPRETEMMTTYRYETSDPATLSKEEITAYTLYSLDESFFTKIVPHLKMTPDLQFIINKYLKRSV